MSLFGTERFFAPQNTPQPPQKGPGRYFEVFWQNMGGLMGANLVCCAGFLPLALGVSLGLVFENFWLTLLGGAAGGAVAGVCWTPMLALAFQAFAGGTRSWLTRWKRAAFAAARPSAAAGAIFGLAGGACLFAGSFAARLLGSQGASPFLVWAVLATDCVLLALAAALAGAVFCLPRQGGEDAKEERAPFLRDALLLLVRAPGPALASALGLLLWCGLGVGLFPVSVPFALAVGFWPPALFCAQLLEVPLRASFPELSWPGQEESLPAGTKPSAGGTGAAGLTARQQSEIFWRRRGPVVAVLVGAIALLAWGGSRIFFAREPDIQIAVVHAEALPDEVLAALERSLAGLAGDLNGDGAAVAQVNDYTVVFDGSAADADRQTAGATLLVSDLAMGDSTLYLVEDPDGFLARYADQVDAQGAALWADCPGLAALDAGEYSPLEQIDTALPGQRLLGPMTVLVSNSADPALREALLG